MSKLDVCGKCNNEMARIDGESFCLVCPDDEPVFSEEKTKPSESTDEQQLLSLSAEDFQRVLTGYLNSSACMSLFSVLIFLRASGENPRVVVKRRGHSLRVQLHRSNGEVQHFNRDGKP